MLEALKHATMRTFPAKAAIAIPAETSRFPDRDLAIAAAALLLTIILVSGICWIVCHCL